MLLGTRARAVAQPAPAPPAGAETAAAPAAPSLMPTPAPPTPAPAPPCPTPAPAPVATQAPDIERPGSALPAPPEPSRYYRRAYARGAMLMTAAPPSFTSEFGGEHAPEGGLWIGGGLTITNTYVVAYIPSFRAHLTLGYSGRHFAIGGDLGGGAGFGFVGIGSADVGLALRFGRFNGVHANLLFYWYAYPLVFPYPAGGELTFRAPVGERSWFQIDLRGDARLGLWGAATFGAKHQISNEPSGATYITWGLGAGWQYPYPGALLQVGYEYRH